MAKRTEGGEGASHFVAGVEHLEDALRESQMHASESGAHPLWRTAVSELSAIIDLHRQIAWLGEGTQRTLLEQTLAERQAALQRIHEQLARLEYDPFDPPKIPKPK